MDTQNKYENRAHHKGTKESNYSVHPTSLFIHSMSESENVRVEVHCADPDYARAKTLAASAPIADQASPNSSAPNAGEVWDMKGYRGGHGYVVLDQAETVDIELWALDPQNNKWFTVASVAGVASYEEFRFPEQVRGRSIWLRLTNIGATIEAITLRFSPE